MQSRLVDVAKMLGKYIASIIPRMVLTYARKLAAKVELASRSSVEPFTKSRPPLRFTA